MENQQEHNQAQKEDNVQDKTTMDVDAPPPLEQTETTEQENKKQKLPEDANSGKIL